MSKTEIDWNDARIKTLTTEWAAGTSADTIATHIGGGCNKNIVIRKAKSLGLGPHPNSPLGKRHKKRAEDSNPDSEVQLQLKAMENASFQSPTTFAKNQVKGKKGAAKAKPPERITVANVTTCHCRWPYGDPQSLSSFHFCGKKPVITPAGKQLPYCDFHARIAYRPPSDMRRDK